MIENKFPGKDITTEDLKTKFPLCKKKNKSHKTIISIDGLKIGADKNLILFAGPNMVESYKLMTSVSKELLKNKLIFVRGGAFKPLTFPYRSKHYYETREKGLEFLAYIRKKYKCKIITEIMESKYLDQIGDAVDIIQIGARNMQNYPFLVDAAKTNKPIMLKRHFGASLRDLLGAAEYILNEGNNKLMLCERGIVAPHTHSAVSRYLLDITAIVALKEITHLPIISDPSHACFNSRWVKSLSLASAAAGADGIMIEIHPNPKNAKVDNLQTLNYKEFRDLLKSLKKIAKTLNKNVI